MSRLSPFRTGALLSLVFLVACAFITYGQRGGAQTSPTRGGGVQPSPAQRGETGRGPAMPGGRGRGQQPPQKKQEDDLDPNNGMIVAYVTVTDKEHRSVPGLKKENFQVTENNVEQSIELFSVESGPVSVGFVLGGPPPESRSVPLAFLKATPWTTNEFFLINDNGHPPGGMVIQSFTTDTLKATTIYPQGGVSMDSIYMGLDYLKEAANHRKLMILVGGTLTGDGATPTGGGMNPDYVERVASKQAVQVYSIVTSNDGGDITDDDSTSNISPLTGGREYLSFPTSFGLESIVQQIARGIAVQYEIGYRSTNPANDGKWRKIKVNVANIPETVGKVSVWTKSGYYADKEKKTK